MRHSLPLASLLLLAPIAHAPAHAQTKPDKTVPLESRSESRALVQQLLRQGKIMAPGEAKRGMKGYALSVFQGVKVEKFDVEVLGVLERVQGGGDLVLIKVTSGPVVERQSGIIEGMSGSPVYLGGKLLGAIAIGWGFPKEPIGGVTPITQMIATALPDNAPKKAPVKMAKVDVTRVDVTRVEVAKNEIFRPRTALNIAGKRIARLEVSRDLGAPPLSGPASGATMRMRPTNQLLQLSGISASSMGRWKAMLAPYGLTPVMGGGGMSRAMSQSLSRSLNPKQVFGIPSKKSGIFTNLAPGAGIGVQLASGDIDATAIGTVTYRLGNRLLAFGHPMFGLGAVSMPMTTTYIQEIFPGYDTSFKLGSPMKDVGELQQDTNFAIGGTVGRRAETVPLRISLSDPAKKINKKFNVRLIKDPIFTPQLAQQISTEALTATLGLDSDKTVRVALSIGLKNGPAIRRTNTLYAADQVIAGGLSDMLDAISLTQSNPYEKGNISSMDLRVEVIQGRKTARIRRLYADKNRVKAGERVQISVVLEPTGQPDAQFTRRFSLQVPDDAPNGVLRVSASSAADFFAARSRVGGAPPTPGNFRELLDAYSQIGAENELLLQASTSKRFLLIDRKKVSNPPPTWSRLIGGTPSSAAQVFNETLAQREKSDWVLSGLESLAIPVESTRSSDRARPDAPAPDDASSSITASASSDSSDDSSSNDDGNDVFVSRVPQIDLDAAPDFKTRARRLTKILMQAESQSPQQIPSPRPAPPLQIVPGATPTPAPSIVPVAGTAAVAPVPTATPTGSSEAGATAIARPAGRWIQRTSTEFGRGKFDGTVVGSDGTLRVGPRSERVFSSAEPVAWSIAADGKGTIYLGTGQNGRILKIQSSTSPVSYALTEGLTPRAVPSEGVAKVLYEGPEVAVTALALDETGNLYAGVSPGGRVYRFRGDGTHQTILQTGAGFVHALAFDSAGNLIVATGGERGAIYRVSQPAQAEAVSSLRGAKEGVPNPTPFAILPQKHARSLSVAGDAIYIGTAGQAVLYRVNAEGQVSALYQAPNSSVSEADSPGAPGGQTIVLSVNGAPVGGQIGGGPSGGGGGGESGGNEITAVAASGSEVYFGTANSGSILRWNAQNGVRELFKTPGRSIYALQLIDGALWAGTGESGEVWRISNLGGDPTGARVLDATQPQILALAHAGNQVFAATGNNAAVYQIGGAGQNGFTSNVFDAGQLVRFGALQTLGSGATFEFRSGNTLEPDATWSGYKTVQPGENVDATQARYAQYRVRLAESGSVSRVEVAFRAPNRAPRVTWASPLGGESFSGKKTLDWTGADPDRDVLRFKLELLGAGGKVQTVEPTSATASSQEVDTKKYADGIYTARVVASDAARNPEDPQSDSATSLPFTIDNTPPMVPVPVVTKVGDLWTATFGAADALSPLAGAEWRLAAGTAKDAKPGDWQAAASSDGLFDAKSETVLARLDSAVSGVVLKSGSSIEFRVRDAAGNSALAKIVLP